MKTLKERLSIAISVLAIGISSLSFYLTVLRPPETRIIAGSSIYIFHDVAGRASVAMSLSMSNNGARLAVVERLGLLVRRAGANEGYLLGPYAFQRINERGEPQDESMSGAVTIPGRSETSKQLLFKASQNDDHFSITSPGEYKFTVLAWLAGKVPPILADSFEIGLSELDASELSHWYQLGITNSLVVERLQWKGWEPGIVGNVDSMLNKVAVH